MKYKVVFTDKAKRQLKKNRQVYIIFDNWLVRKKY